MIYMLVLGWVAALFFAAFSFHVLREWRDTVKGWRRTLDAWKYHSEQIRAAYEGEQNARARYEEFKT